MAYIGDQFSTGDQGDDRIMFFKSGRNTCPRCKVRSITMENHCAGCRHDGNAYGTEVFTCTKCNWATSFQYDEGGDGPYYYEMAGVFK
ncbi:hypothetical protein EON65_36690 [archaeon]|nr:MAG: hypothetical protein EON65_36690 [archaeon]